MAIRLAQHHGWLFVAPDNDDPFGVSGVREVVTFADGKGNWLIDSTDDAGESIAIAAVSPLRNEAVDIASELAKRNGWSFTQPPDDGGGAAA